MRKCSLSELTMFKFCNDEMDIEDATDIELHINYCFDCQLRFIKIWDSLNEESHCSQSNKVREKLKQPWISSIKLSAEIVRAHKQFLELQNQNARLIELNIALTKQRKRLINQKKNIDLWLAELSIMADLAFRF